MQNLSKSAKTCQLMNSLNFRAICIFQGLLPSQPPDNCTKLGNKRMTCIKTIEKINYHKCREAHTKSTLDKKHRNKIFPVIKEKACVDKNSEQFRQNKEKWGHIVEKYREAVEICVGKNNAEVRVKSQAGKLSVTEKVKALVDNFDDFLELSVLGGVGMEYGHVPRANILTGIGKVEGQYCLILAFDAFFKGGAIFPVTLKKQLRAQEIGLQNRLPCIYIVDSAGAFLSLQSDIFNPGGQIFYNQAIMSSAQIPQIALVCGSCTAGGAYVPTMSSENVITENGTLFLGGPPLVQAALGEKVSAKELGGAFLHCRTSGCTDHFSENETDAYVTVRNIIASLNLSLCPDFDVSNIEEPQYDISDISGLLSSENFRQHVDMYQVIARIVDGSRFQEFKALFGQSLLTGFAHIHGYLVGVIANQGRIHDKEATKGAHFIQLCCERDIPLVFLQNTTSDADFKTETKEDAKSAAATLKSRAKMLTAVSCASVPKLTVIVGGGFGSGHYLMGGRAVSPNFLFAWPNAQVALMEPDQLALALAAEQGDKALARLDSNELVVKLDTESSAIYGASRILNDGVILPEDTRKVLSQCLAICKAYRPQKQPQQEQNVPMYRM